MNEGEPISIDHKVAILLVNCWGFATVTAVEELWECATLDGVDLAEVEPGSIARNDDFHGLRGEISARTSLESLTCSLELGWVIGVVALRVLRASMSIIQLSPIPD